MHHTKPSPCRFAACTCMSRPRQLQKHSPGHKYAKMLESHMCNKEPYLHQERVGGWFHPLLQVGVVNVSRYSHGLALEEIAHLRGFSASSCSTGRSDIQSMHGGAAALLQHDCLSALLHTTRKYFQFACLLKKNLHSLQQLLLFTALHAILTFMSSQVHHTAAA